MKILDLHGEGGWRNGYREQVGWTDKETERAKASSGEAESDGER